MPVPSIALAASRTSSGVLTSFTPPALPRPPAWICALTTQWLPPIALAASAASLAVRATRPGGTGMPTSANSCLAWYSWKFMRHLRMGRRGRRTGPRTGWRAGRGRIVAGNARQRQKRCRRMAGRDLPPTAEAATCRTSLQDTASPQHRELYFFALFRVLEAGILGIVAFTPLGQTMAEIREPVLLKLAAVGYFLGALFAAVC